MNCPRCGNECTEERRRRGSLVDFWCYLCCFAFSITRRAEPGGEAVVSEEPVWIIRSLTKWEDFEPNKPYHRFIGGVKGPKGCIGCMLVFDDYAAAVAYAGDQSKVQAAYMPQGGEKT